MNSTEIALLLNNDSDKITRIGEIIGKKIAIWIWVTIALILFFALRFF